MERFRMVAPHTEQRRAISGSVIWFGAVLCALKLSYKVVLNFNRDVNPENKVQNSKYKAQTESTSLKALKSGASH